MGTLIFFCWMSNKDTEQLLYCANFRFTQSVLNDLVSTQETQLGMFIIAIHITSRDAPFFAGPDQV